MSVAPTAYEQYLLELINWARAHPEDQAQRLGIGLNDGLPPNAIPAIPARPLDFAAGLLDVARTHSQWMIDHDTLSHIGADGADAAARIRGEGYWVAYEDSNRAVPENIFRQIAPDGSDLASLILAAHNGLFADPTARLNMLDSIYTFTGLGASTGSIGTGADANSLLLTEDFSYLYSMHPSLPQPPGALVGVVIDDRDGDDFYTVGEGLGGVFITAAGSGGTFHTMTRDAGGFSLALPAGDYTVTFDIAGKTTSANLTMGYGNGKIDAELGAFTPSSNGPILGNPTGEAIVGTDAGDFIVGSSGLDTIDGRGGVDAVFYLGCRTEYAILRQGNEIVVAKPDGGGTDTLRSIERIDFDEGHLVFDIDSSNAPAAYRLYGGTFVRQPDEAGLRFWTHDWLDMGRTLHDAAAFFITSEEFVRVYGSELSDDDFVGQLYRNVLHREGEPDGVAFWDAYLEHHSGDRADVLVNFTQLPEHVGASAANIENGLWVI